MSEAIKVGTMVLAVRGTAKGRVGEVVAVRTGDPYSHQVDFGGEVSGFMGAWLVNDNKPLWCRRTNLIPLTPPGEPETLIEETPVRDEVPA